MEEFKICSETGTKITKDMVIGCYSDTYKSINGIRPRWIDWSGSTMDEIGEELTILQAEAEEAYKREVQWEREQRKIRSKREKRYQKIRKAAKSGFELDTFTLGEVMAM